MPRVSEEQSRPLLCERGLCGRIWLLAVARVSETREERDAMRYRALRTNVKKGGAEWMDGKRKPWFEKISPEIHTARPSIARNTPLAVLYVEKFICAITLTHRQGGR